MNKKNWLLLFFACAIAFTSFNSCSKDDDDDSSTDTGPTEWSSSLVFPGYSRSGAASFTADGSTYVVGGYVNPSIGFPNDGYKFDGSWSSIEAFPGEARHEAVGFSINGIGYVGTGLNMDKAFNDFYSYNPANDSWAPIADFPGDARYGAVAFSLGNYGYVGLGREWGGARDFVDFYRYDPSDDTWEEIETPPFNNKRAYAFAFVIGDKAYVGGGRAGNSTNLPGDFVSFDGSAWQKLNPLERNDDDHTYDARKYGAAAFTVGNYGYVVSGRNANTITSTVWKYEPSSDTWTDKHQALTVDPREKAVGFTFDGKGYITTGVNSNGVLDNTYEFTPRR